MTSLHLRSTQQVDELISTIRASARRAQDWIAAQSEDSLEVLKRMKFEPVGFHPIEDRAVNVLEQINQTWTYFVAAEATRQLLTLHPNAGGFHLAPGAHASLALDVMSDEPGLVGAETFAAVDPRNNRKLYLDLKKMSNRADRHRYVFFMSPLYPALARQPLLENSGEVQVWSLKF